MTYICDLAKKHNLSPIITFDQPLFWKASEIIYNAPPKSPLKNIALLLGSFHAFMNVLGAIGALMQGSGLDRNLTEVYGENAVKHTLTGKSAQRAFTGHLLVTSSLYSLLAGEKICDDAAQFYEHILTFLSNDCVTAQAVAVMDEYVALKQASDDKKYQISISTHTEKFWIGYLDMVKTSRVLVMSDKTGSWNLHLAAASKCCRCLQPLVTVIT